MNTSELIGSVLDYWVAKAEGVEFCREPSVPQVWDVDAVWIRGQQSGETKIYSPSTNWAQGGPIIEREYIKLSHGEDGVWRAGCYDETTFVWNRADGRTPLIAAMRAYVASKFGDEVADMP